MIKSFELENVKILDIGNSFGNMNTTASFYPKEMTLEERQMDFLRRRMILARENGFNGKKMFMADQSRKDGSYCVLTRELINEKEDGWLRDIPEDILVITKDTPGVVIGHPIADCPVIIMTDRSKGVTALGHCSGEMIDKELPINIFKALKKEFGTNLEDVKVYVSSCISEKWEYNCWPGFAKNKQLWEGSIVSGRQEGETTYYNINIRHAIAKQLESVGIANDSIYWNMDDTLTDSRYYSNCASRFDKSKAGRNFVGAYYPLSQKEKVKEKTR